MKTKSGPSSSSTSRSHHLNFKEEPMVTNSDEEEEDDDDEVYGANSLSKAELDRLVEEHLRSDDTQTAAFWAEKRLAIDGGRTLNERLPQIAQYLAVSSLDCQVRWKEQTALVMFWLTSGSVPWQLFCENRKSTTIL
jgi:hypothetical protein